jgi:hypothetical protein
MENKNSDWKGLKNVSLSNLERNRGLLHQAIQIVGAVPRNLLPEDPTDGSASMNWDSSRKSLVADPIEINGKKTYVGLGLSNAILFIKTEKEINTFDLNGQSTIDGLNWVKTQLNKLGYDSEKVTLKLPYEIPAYDSTQNLSFDSQGIEELARLYNNISIVLQSVTEKLENALAVKCWPHHFDIATLIPVEEGEDGVITKSIGIGLSPGDEGTNQPYIYINAWPNIPLEDLKDIQLSIGDWNKDGWSGAKLEYSQMLDLDALELENFIDSTVKILDSKI